MISGHNQPVLVTVCMMRKAGEEKGSGMGPDLSPSVGQWVSVLVTVGRTSASVRSGVALLLVCTSLLTHLWAQAPIPPPPQPNLVQALASRPAWGTLAG